VGSVTGTIFTAGGATGSAETGVWVTEGMVFYLLDRSNGELLDTVTVRFTEIGCPPPVITANPNPVQVCDEGGAGQTVIEWDATDIAEALEIRVGSVDGALLARGGPTGSAETGRWVTEGLTFYLLNETSGELLDSVVVTLTESGCPFVIRETLSPHEQITLTADSFLSTNSTLERPFGDFDGWVDLDTDEPSLAGIFLTYDGALNRIDGGLVSSAGLEEAVFPEVPVANGFSTRIEVVNPTFTNVDLDFDLFDATGTLLGSAARSVFGQSRAVYPVVRDVNNPNSVGLFDDVGAVVLIAANPNPIQVCEEGGLGQTTISWDTSGIAEEVEVRVGSVDGTVLASGGATGSAESGELVTEGLVFFLLDSADGTVLDTVTVRLTQSGCPPPVLLATPNPILVCDASGVGQTAISWDATGIAEATEVRVGSAEGSVLATGGATGSQSTDRSVTDGTNFYLLDQSSREVLDTVTVTLTSEGCPLEGFQDGYIRVVGRGFVAFESFADSKRLAVLPAQPLNQDAVRFTMPHFIAFGGSDTVLKLIHPSSLPVNGILEEEEEHQEADPILVSAMLRGDDGSTLGQPLTVELRDGESLRESVIDLFGLPASSSVQSGWIEITADRPGLLGSAEIQAFDGEALSAVPLQPVQNSKVVFPHVAQALGFSSGLAIVNAEAQPAEVTIELREKDTRLVGTIGPVAIQPGHRLIGTIPELFPGAGALLGGTIKVLSDRPLTTLELFYTDDLRLLSAVPSQKIE
jgi:hypothetical protein